jgi:hypothetical protein
MDGEVRSAGAGLFFGVPSGEPLWASDEFFTQAVHVLKKSTHLRQELAGAVNAREEEGRFLLVGLIEKEKGAHRYVSVSAEWGSLLWHTHPGLSGTLAAFSDEDLKVARTCGRPLLVIGYGSLSVEVMSTLTLPLGRRAFFISAGIKGLMWLENQDILPTRLLDKGVAVRVCYPDGQIRPVMRLSASPSAQALSEVGFMIDKSVGRLERKGQQIAKRIFALLGSND